MLILLVHTVHDIGRPAASCLDAQNLEPREAVEKTVRDHRHHSRDDLREAAQGETEDGAEFTGLVEVAKQSSAAVEADDHVEADGNARILAFVPYGVERIIGKALALDRFGSEENALETQLEASAQLRERGVRVLESDMRDRNDPAAIVGGEVIQPFVVGTRVGGR